MNDEKEKEKKSGRQSSAARIPSVIILAGPNGAGKSTAAPSLLRGQLRVSEFVNADVIARGISAFEPEKAAISAGRVMLTRLHELAAQRKSFAFETTLASRSFAPWIEGLIKDGFQFHLIFLWLPSPDVAIDRVDARIRDGGHSVPKDVILRRYQGGLRSFFDLYRLSTSWRMYNNSNMQLEIIAEGSGSGKIEVYNEILWSHIEKLYHEKRS